MSLAIIALLAVFAIREYTHFIHDTRRDKLISELTSKVMADSFAEYVDMTMPVLASDPVNKSEEELYWDEIERNKV